MLLKVRMKNCGINVRGICKVFMLHLEMVMIEGLNQKNSEVVIDVIENYGWEILGFG
jgi:hypothetical protein